MDVPNSPGERASTPRSSPAAGGPVTGATDSGPASTSAVGRNERQPESREAGLTSHEDPWDQSGRVQTHSADHGLERHDIQEQADEAGRNESARPSANFGMPSVDLTTRSEFFAVDKQLAQYFKRASTMNWPLLLALLSSTFCGEKRRHIRTFRVSSALSLSLNLLPLFLAGWMAEKEPSGGDDDDDDETVEPRDRYRILGLCIAAYLSNVSLTVTAVSFLMLLSVRYAWFFFILAILIWPYYFIVKHGIENGITWGVAQYAEHRSDMDFFFGLCFEITQTNFTALSATLFGYLKRNQCTDVNFRAPEIILLFAVVIGLFVMTMCTVPPAAGLPCYRDSFVRTIMKFTIYGLLVLTSIGLLLAVLNICGWYVFLSFIIVAVDVLAYRQEFLRSTVVAVFKGVARCVQERGISRDVESQALAASSEAGNTSQRSMEVSASRTRNNQQTSQWVPPRAAGEQSLLLISFYSVMSGALMVSYSLNIGARSWGRKACLISMYSAIVAYLGMVVIMREATQDKTIAVWVSIFQAAFLLLGALICVIVFILSNPLNVGSSST